MNDSATDQKTDRVLFLWLLLASLLGNLAGVPWAIAVLADPASAWLSAVIEGLLLLAPASAAGVWLGKKVGLGCDLRELVSGNAEGWRSVRLGRLPAIVVGLAVGGVGFCAQKSVPDSAWIPALGHPTAFDWFLRSLSAALTEEIFFRLGLIALFAWVILSVLRRPAIRVPSLWIGNVLSAILFAAAHLPQLSSHGWGLRFPLIVFSACAGLIMGGVYIRYGLISAVVAHFTCDLVANVIPRMIPMAALP